MAIDKSTQSAQSAQAQQDAKAEIHMETSADGVLTIKVPFVSASLRLPQLKATMGLGGEQAVTAQNRAVTRLALYAGLVALGVTGAVEWPVVLVATAGTYVLSQRGSGLAQDSHLDEGV